MTKGRAAAEAAPRRSTRARTKRSADSDGDDGDTAAPPRASKAAPAETKPDAASKGRGRKPKAEPKQAAVTEADPDTVTKPLNKKPKTTKATKQHATDSSQTVKQVPASKQSSTKPADKKADKEADQKTDKTTKAASKLSSTAAAKTVQANQSGSNQPAAADPACPKAHVTSVAGDADVMLNQTNIGANNNKYYRMQLLQEENNDHWLWTRWGRVGDKGQTQLQGPFDAETGYKEFKKKFRSKVGAAFEDKEEARKVRSGKYSLVDLDSFQSPPVSPGATKPKPVKVTSEFEESKLEAPTKELMELIFSDIMFQQAMQEFDIDTERLPLGQLSKDQVQRGYDVLERIRGALNGDGGSLESLSSEFYQVIPHNFGRQRPPIIHTQSAVEDKIRMCDVLSDIEVAQDLLEPKQQEEEQVELQPHPADEKYATLKADLKIIPPKEEEYRVIEKYCQATGAGPKLLNVWRVDRHAEAAAFARHSELGNRRLLWHGTNIAVVAAILKAGLRIMPHACGRVGRGLYLASEQSKSAAYVSCGHKGKDLIGVMFLTEAALGQEHHITRDDPSLTKAPAGFQSVVAKGRTEPDPTQDIKLDLQGNAVQVPQGKPVQVPQFQNSSFTQSEYLLYQESQARIRYMLTMRFSHAGSWH